MKLYDGCKQLSKGSFFILKFQVFDGKK